MCRAMEQMRDETAAEQNINGKKKRSPPTNHVKFTQCVNGLVSIMLPSVSQPLLYISFCKKQCHKESYCGGHRFLGTQNTFDLEFV